MVKNMVKTWKISLLGVLVLTILEVPPAAAAGVSCTAFIPVRVQVYGQTNAVFTVQLEAEAGTPLPEERTLTFTGNGEGFFGGVEYTTPGDYVYTLTQVKGEADHVSYDDTVYTVTVRVINHGTGKLVAEIWAVRNQSTHKSAEVLFSNRYTPSDQTPVLPPQTGDTANLWAMMAMFGVSAVALVVMLVVARRNNKK